MRPALPLISLLVAAIPLQAQRPPAGPTIQAAGAVFEISDPSFETPEQLTYKLAFEMAQAAPSPDELNVTLNSVARYLNMHAQAGISERQVQAAVVVHGPAGWEVLDDAAYHERHGVNNPNAELIRELLDAGVQVVLCGQTSASRGIPRDGLIEGVDVALSAMTAFLVLQEDGFRVNPW